MKRFVLYAVLCLKLIATVHAQPNVTALAYDGVHELQLTQAQLQEDAVDAGSSKLVALPDEWSKSKRSGLHHYQIDFSMPQSLLQETTVLRIHRIGNRFSVQLNGIQLVQKGLLNEQDISDYSRQPQLVVLPEQLLNPHNNRINISVYGDPNRYAGLSRLDIGPQSVTYERFRDREIVQFWLLYAFLGVAVFFAALSIGLAVATREKIFIFFTLACVFSVIRILSYLVVHPPMPYDLWIWLTETSHVAFIVSISLFGLWFLALPKKPVYFLTTLMMTIAVILIPLYAFFHLYEFRKYNTLSLLVYGTSISGLVVWTWYKRRDVSSAILASAAFATVLFGLYDHILVFYSADGYSSFTISRFALFFFLLAMGYIIVFRFAERAKNERALRKNLALQLAEKSAALDVQFEQKQGLLQDQAKTKERERMVRDIHDGMGLHLSGILGLIESDHLDKTALSTEVRTALDHLRLLVNNSETFEGDWLVLFGTIRHLIETRLRRFGIQLLWSMPIDNVPSLPVEPLQASSLQRLVFELTTNVIKHSKARAVSVSIRYTPHYFDVIFSDNGIGFNKTALLDGLGQRSILHRVQELKAQLVVTDQEGQAGIGCAYQLRIPLQLKT